LKFRLIGGHLGKRSEAITLRRGNLLIVQMSDVRGQMSEPASMFLEVICDKPRAPEI
jgi:hypothetical protein